MELITVNDFIAFAIIHLQNRFAILEANCHPFLSQGGWEGWVQTEIAMAFANSAYDVQREQRIYDDYRMRTDLLLNKNIAISNCKVAVEIKCQSIYLKNEQMMVSINADLQKLINLHTDCQKLAIVFVVEPILLDKLLVNGYKEYYVTEGLSLCAKMV